MYNLRICGVIAALVLLGTGPGGCPMMDEMLQETGPSADELSGDATGDSEQETVEQSSRLNDLASQIASGGEVVEYAWSDDSTTISVNPRTDGIDPGLDDRDIYTGTGPGGGGDDGDDGSDDSDGTDGSDDDPLDDPTGGVYDGTVTCAYREALWDDDEDYGDITDTLTYTETLILTEQGVPASIPVHPFICNDHTVRFRTTARFPGETETFVFDESTPDFNVAIRVVSATYTPQSAHVVLSIDFGWISGESSIIASGTHTLDTRLVAGDDLAYTAHTGYEGVFTAADDWVGYATVDYDCSGTLHGH